MSNDLTHDATFEEANRQLQICNACRYCEGYCSAFPAITRRRAFARGDITHIANLCHNCRGCYYACQYTAPHEFDLNLPRILAELRRESWETYAWPGGLARRFQKNAWATVIATVLGFAVMFGALRHIGSSSGEGFYAVLSHGAMVAIFLPAFVLPLIALSLGARRYWQDVGGQKLRFGSVTTALRDAMAMRNLKGGHGDGCNFENAERFSDARRYAHHAVMYGFLLCFASTATGTILHYVFAMPAPYPLWSLPKVFGLTGGLLLSIGCVWMLALKQKSDATLTDPKSNASSSAFVALLGFVGFSGLVLYALGGTTAMPVLLALHLGSVLSFFLLSPYTKMAHSVFRLTAMLRDTQETAPD